MIDLRQVDPLELDRRIRDAACAWRRARRTPALLVQGDIGYSREIAGRDLYRELCDLPDGDPLREPLKRWVYRLAEQRINCSALAAVWAEQHATQVVIDAPEHDKLARSQLLARALSDSQRRRAWLNAFLDHAEPISLARGRLWERRAEVARGMGVGDPDAVELCNPEIGEIASTWLSASAELSAQLPRDAALLVEALLCEAVADGWPTRMNPQVLTDLVDRAGLFHGLDLNPGRLPAYLAPASLLRAFRRLGAAWADAAASRHQPFVIAHEPYGLHRLASGALFASLLLTPAFLRRRLGMGQAQRDACLRALALSALCDARLAALALLLRRPALASATNFRSAFAEGIEETLGLSLPAHAAGALAPPRVDSAQRFAAFSLAARRAVILRDTHDEDWFDNPRAIDQLRAEAELSPQPFVERALLDEGMLHLERELAAHIR